MWIVEKEARNERKNTMRQGVFWIALPLLIFVGFTLIALKIITEDQGDGAALIGARRLTFEDVHRALINKDYNDVPELSDVHGGQIAALCLMGLCLALASAGGVGGGPMFVPILTIFLDYSLKRATPISNVIIVGGGLANNAFNIVRAHPRRADKTAIDYDLVIVMVPMVMAGAVTGVFLSTILPAYAVGILMVGVLAFCGYKSVLKGMNMRKKEQAAKAAKAPPKVLADSVAAPSGSAAVADSGTVQVNLNGTATASSKPIEAEKKPTWIENTPWKKVGYLCLCFAGIVALSLGGEAAGCGSAGYWVLYWLEVPWAAAFSILAMISVENHHRKMLAAGETFSEGDVAFTKKLAVRFLGKCMFTGIMAGTFGIGGGVFIGPLLVEMKVLPQVASATTAALVLFASAIAVIKFTLSNAIIWNSYALLFFLMGLIITYMSQYFIAGYVRRTGAASIIVLSIGTSIVFGSALMAYLTVVLLVETTGGSFFNTEFCK